MLARPDTSRRRVVRRSSWQRFVSWRRGALTCRRRCCKQRIRAAHEGKGELTERERDVLRLMVKGFANKEIARDLHIAPDTVKNHARAIYAALGIASRADAACAVERRGIKLG